MFSKLICSDFWLLIRLCMQGENLQNNNTFVPISTLNFYIKLLAERNLSFLVICFQNYTTILNKSN